MATQVEYRRPTRLQRGSGPLAARIPEGAANVGPGSKWSNPIRKNDVEALLSEADIAAAYRQAGWKAAAVILYRDYIREEEHDLSELRGKNLICTCRLLDPCHADVLLELANA